MTLSDVIDFSLLQRYDGKLKAWVLALVPTADVLYTDEDPEVISGEKQAGDVKIPGHNGLITKTQLDKLVNLGLKIKKSAAEPVSIVVSADGTYTIDVSDKADKVSGATEGHLASLTASGNLADSGKSVDDFVQGAKLGDTTLTKDSNGVVTITNDLSQYNNGTSDFQSGAEVDAKIAAAVASGINFRGSVDRYSLLPASPAGGDMYNVVNSETISGETYPGDMNYTWVDPVLYKEGDEIPEGKEAGDVKTPGFWDPQAPIININAATNSQIDSLFA